MDLDALKNNNSKKILLHEIIWCFFIITSLIQFYKSPFHINADFYVQWITGIIIFYFNYFYLVPILLLKKKYWSYLAILLVLVAVFMTIRYLFFIPEFHEMVPPNRMHPHKIFDSAGREIARNKMF